ncbi:hypothetical protein BGZ96_000734 [Linnemannia gamsii]|uniref:S-adenosyl-L-methionine-dependent methyltransferase n=1 Tax=Linnemannia gamsii TaxID=64522 RepID=A0ABQ7JNQ6_9FUNG|nr:hypothetical protein BGZ96_000734 [Linnemannia gamsii]
MGVEITDATKEEIEYLSNADAIPNEILRFLGHDISRQVDVNLYATSSVQNGNRILDRLHANPDNTEIGDYMGYYIQLDLTQSSTSWSTLIMSRLDLLTEPWIFVWISLTHVPATIRALVATKDYGTLFSPSGFREALFGIFWETIGPQIKAGNEERVVALLEGRISGGRIHDKAIGASIHGTVLEVGAGSGNWADVLARFRGGVDAAGSLRNRKNAGSGITKIYGVEPNPISAKALQKRVNEVGLQDIYQVVPVGIEFVDDPTAWDGKIEPGSVDCIVGIMCMCSIPEPEKNIQLLYKLLKPGGHWFVYEHVKVSRGNSLLRFYQWFCNIPWSVFMGSCRLCRDTETTLRATGAWQEIDLAQSPDHTGYEVIPTIIGTLRK